MNLNEIKDALTKLLPQLGKMGVDRAANALEDLADKTKYPWQKAIVEGIADAVDKHGPDGIDIAQKAILALIDGKEVEMDFTDLRNAHELISAMENAEADRKSEARDFVRRVGNSASTLLGALLRGIVG